MPTDMDFTQRRSRFVYGTEDNLVTWETELPVAPWDRRSVALGGRLVAGSGTPAAYVIRTDHHLQVPVRFRESEWEEFFGLLAWGMTGASFTWYPDALEDSEFYTVWLESPQPGVDIQPVRDTDYPKTMRLTIEMRGVTGNPWRKEYFNYEALPPDTPILGLPIYLPVDGSRGEPATEPAGTYADIGVRHQDQQGDETLEVWVQERSGSGELERVSSGLLARHVAGDAEIPFDLADWEAASNIGTLDLVSGELRIRSASTGTDGGRGLVRYLPLASRSKILVFARIRLMDVTNTNNSEGEVGIGVHHNGLDEVTVTYSRIWATQRWTDATFNSRRVWGIVEIDDSVTVDSDTQSQGYAGNNDALNIYDDSPGVGKYLYADGDEKSTYDFLDDTVHSVGPAGESEGVIGFYHRWVSGVSASQARLTRMFAFTDRIISVTGVPAGGSVEILNAADGLLASESESGGEVSLDIMDQAVAYPGPAKIQVKDSGGTVLSVLEPPDGVWGGDTYELPVGDGGLPFLAASVQVTTNPTQVVRTQVELDPEKTYDVSIRYKRGSATSPGAVFGEDSLPASTWPAVSQGEFTTTADPPTMQSAVWSRTASDAERITLTILPIDTDSDITVWRKLVSESSWTELDTLVGPHSPSEEYVDEAISGEVAYHYAVSTGGGARGASTRVWAGPAGVPVFIYTTPLGAGYVVGFDPGNDDVLTELHDTYDNAGGEGGFNLRATTSTEGVTTVESGTLVNVPAPSLTFLAKLRHVLTSFTVTDYGEFSSEFNVTALESE